MISGTARVQPVGYAAVVLLLQEHMQGAPAHLAVVPLVQCSGRSNTGHGFLDARSNRVGPKVDVGNSCASQET